jgi:hypothetical protein
MYHSKSMNRMKKQLLLVAALMVGLTAFSQKTHRVAGWKIARDIPQNEFKLNLGTTIFGSFPELSYERLLNTDISVGASLGVALEDDVYPTHVLFTPYFRWFFGGNSENLQKYGTGFFIEANGGLFTRSVDELFYENGMAGSREETVTGAGLGLAVGWKYLTRNNWVGEFYFGGGRDFVNDGAYPRMGLTIGRRF